MSEHNFPEVKAIVDECRRGLGYDQTVEVYVRQGSARAFLFKFFSRKFMVVQADFIDEASRAELVWLTGRFVGMLKAKHDRLSLLTALVGVSGVRFMNLLLYPYERAVVYSGDPDGAVHQPGPRRLAAGAQSHDRRQGLEPPRQQRGLFQQRLAIHGRFLPWLLRVTSSHPHLVDRHADLFRFAEEAIRACWRATGPQRAASRHACSSRPNRGSPPDHARRIAGVPETAPIVRQSIGRSPGDLR